MIVTSMILIVSLVVLILGAELLVKGAVQLAAAMGISSLIIGLTVVAFGTGSPELVVGVVASIKGETSIALGNVIGSNIVNTLCILGISATIYPLVVHHQLVIWDIPIMIAASLLVYIAGYYGVITPLIGLFMVFLMFAYIGFLVFMAKKEDTVEEETKLRFKTESSLTLRGILLNLFLVVLGIILLQLGATYLVESAVKIAAYFGLSELLISLTIIAIGTSLPELATSIVASFRGKRDIAVGNIVGSNIFNILAVLGASSLVAKNGMVIPEQAFYFDLPVMGMTAIACLPIFLTGHRIDRWEGVLFLGYYFAYLALLILFAIEHAWHYPFYIAMLVFVVPLTIVTLGIGVYRHLNGQKA